MIEGLCVGGGIDVHAKQVGFVAFLRNDGDNKVDDKNGTARTFTFHSSAIAMKPMLEQWQVIPLQSDCSVRWCDGDWPQICAITNPVIQQQSEALSHNDCKHAAGATGTEQPADLTSCFRTVNSLEKRTTNVNCDGLLINHIHEIFTEDSVLNLKATKQSALVDFLSRVLELIQSACPPRSIKKGFIESKLIDKFSCSVADFDKIFLTCRCNITTEELANIERHFSTLYHKVLDKGHILDEMLVDCNFALDLKKYLDVKCHRPMPASHWNLSSVQRY